MNTEKGKKQRERERFSFSVKKKCDRRLKHYQCSDIMQYTHRRVWLVVLYVVVDRGSVMFDGLTEAKC